MRSYTTYDWMLASGLALKGLPLSLFAMTASYNRKGRRMYESRESLAGYLGYSERQVGKALQSLVSTELLVLRLTDGHREFRINIRLINIFFFKNNCNPKQEIERFVKFYEGRGWKLGGGKTMTSKEEIKKAAESWTVKGIQQAVKAARTE